MLVQQALGEGKSPTKLLSDLNCYYNQSQVPLSFRFIISNFWEDKKRCLQFGNICIVSGDTLTLKNLYNICKNERTDDIIHSAQYNIK